jgi:hypothetical protein
VLVLPDALVFPALAEVRPVLRRRPCPGAAEILNAERWLDAVRDAVHPVCYHRMVGAILEGHLARRALKAAGAGKLAAHAQRPADAVLVRPALGVLKVSHDLQPAAARFFAAGLYTQAEDQFAA